MPAYGVTVEKEFTFRDTAERFANIYHYRIAAPIESDYNTLAEAVLARDRLVYGSAVTYKTVRVFGPTEGDPDENRMRLVKDVTGTGSGTFTTTPVYRELSIVPAIYVGRSPIKHRKVFVRKFIRVTHLKTSSDSPTNGDLSQATKDWANSWMNGNKLITHNAIQFSMCTPRDVAVPGDNQSYTLHFMRIRQLKQ